MNEALESKLEKCVVRRFGPYREYRDSPEVEWLRQIPRHWMVRRLKATIGGSYNGVWGDPPTGEDEDIRCVRVADFDRTRARIRNTDLTVRCVSHRQRDLRQLTDGDLLLEKSGGGERQPVGFVALYEDIGEPAVCSNFIARMPVTEGYDPVYMCYLHGTLYAGRVNTRSIKQSTGIQNLDSDAYLQESVPIPPTEEQRTIADFLDRETAKVDALVAKKERLIELLREKRTALITQAVTKGLDPNIPMKDSGMEWLGQIPAHWTTIRLMFKTAFGHPIMYGIVLPGLHYEGGIPIVKGGDVAPDRLHRELLRCTDPGIEAAYLRSRLRENDLVYAIRGSIGAVELVPGDVAGSNITQDVAKIAPHPSVSPRWLLYVMSSTPIFSQLEAGALGATIRGINIRDLKRCRIPLPPRDEQDRIASVLDQQMATGDALVAKIRDGIERLKEYRTALISAAVTGRIDVRSAS